MRQGWKGNLRRRHTCMWTMNSSCIVDKELATFALQFDFEKKVGMRPLGEWHVMTVVSNIHDNPNLLKENSHE